MLQQETQCSILGIPRSFLLSSRGGGSTAMAVAQQSNNIVASTIQWWRVVLGRLLTVVYHQIYGTEDAQSVVKQLGRKRKFNAIDAFEENFVEVLCSGCDCDASVCDTRCRFISLRILLAV